MPFGLKNASSEFSKAMATVFAGIKNNEKEGVIVYIDDILIYTKVKDFRHHLAQIREVFEKIRDFNLKLSPKKCVFARKRLQFLGN